MRYRQDQPDKQHILTLRHILHQNYLTKPRHSFQQISASKWTFTLPAKYTNSHHQFGNAIPNAQQAAVMQCTVTVWIQADSKNYVAEYFEITQDNSEYLTLPIEFSYKYKSRSACCSNSHFIAYTISARCGRIPHTHGPYPGLIPIWPKSNYSNWILYLEAVSIKFIFLSPQPTLSGDYFKSGSAGQFLSYWAKLLKRLTRQTDKTNLSHDGLNPAHDPF